jgi:hypothetical protein
MKGRCSSDARDKTFADKTEIFLKKWRKDNRVDKRAGILAWNKQHHVGVVIDPILREEGAGREGGRECIY